MQTKRHLAGAIAWILSAILIPAQIIVALMWPRGYSLTGNTISDLGVTACAQYAESGQHLREVCSPGFQLFNISMIISGALIVLGALLLHGWWNRRSGRVGTICLAIAGAAVAVVGLAPWDLYPEFHDAFATAQAILQWSAMLLLAIAAGPGAFRRVTVAAAVVSVAGFLLFVSALEGAQIPVLGLGGSERLSFDTLTVWNMCVGIAILAHTPVHRRGRLAKLAA